jgi:hypothetical protein
MSGVSQVPFVDRERRLASRFAALFDCVSDVFRADPLLCQLGLALFLFAVLFAALIAYPIQVEGVSVWIKPIKFDISFGTYSWTVAWWFSLLRVDGNQRTLLRRLFFTTIAVEVTGISVQAVRTAITGVAMASWLDSGVAILTTTMILFNTLLVIWIAYLFWRTSYADLYTWANRLGILIFLVGNAIGGQMLVRHNHTIGIANNGAGLPFLNWNTIGGDLRISHFLSIHAIQSLPLSAFVILRFWPYWIENRQRRALLLAAFVFSAFIMGTYIEAMLGIPLLRWAR